LNDYSDDIAVRYFTQGNEAINFINSSKEKNRIFLLADYELRNQEINGVDVIEKCNMQNKSILVTSVYMCKIKEFPEKCDVIKVLSKALIPDIPIVIEEERETENVAIVIIDNDKSIIHALPTFFKDNGLAVDVYTDPRDFLDNLHLYSKDIVIVTDHDLGCDIGGFDLAKKAHELGYTKLYMMSGDMFDKSDVPSYLTLLFKDTNSFEKLLKIANESNCPRPT
jgi:FixJ family two-component response regulator